MAANKFTVLPGSLRDRCFLFSADFLDRGVHHRARVGGVHPTADLHPEFQDHFAPATDITPKATGEIAFLACSAALAG